MSDPWNRDPEDVTTVNAGASPEFSFTDSDVTIRSSDGVLFQLHKRNLHMHSDIFPDENTPTDNQIVDLPESSDVLKLLFQYMYRRTHPDIESLDFPLLSHLAEAAEKYRVFSAMDICKIVMRISAPKNPVAALAYATRHCYSAISEIAAPLTISAEIPVVLAALGAAEVVPWVLYRENWLDVQKRLLLEANAPLCDTKFHKNVWRDLREYLCASLDNIRTADNKLDSIRPVTLESCSGCNASWTIWVTALRKEMAVLPKYTP